MHPSPPDVLSDLFRRFGGLIYARCERLLGDPASAEDMTQETFVRVHKHLTRVAQWEDALPFIYRVATNLCLNELRDRRGRPLPFGETATYMGGADPGERLLDQAVVRHLVSRVPTKVGIAAWLYHVDGFDQNEIAALLGISRGTVVNRLSEFMDRSRRFLGAHANTRERKGA